MLASSDERKLAASSLIPLEIEPESILSLSKGVIFDTIVHNVECTLNNRCTDPLPWKLIGMSLICDPSRNKNYLQKLQKMQCVPSVICTQIYHSKLVKNEFGVLTTPGRKIVLGTVPRKRLTGIIVCRSIDELLYMESPTTENVHFIQYKLLSYERIATRELVNGPKLSSVGDRIIKTVFDFELTQKSGFPRQLLPVAIISFGRQAGCDLSLSIRNFLKLDEHQTFDKSYLVTSKNIELDRLREEQERKEDAEAEIELPWEKVQRRQPLADLSKKSTDTGNARPSTIPQPSLRVPPLKIKLSRPEKSIKPFVPVSSVDSKFRCLLKLDRVDLSLYNISNLPSSSPINIKKINESSPGLNPTNTKTKSLMITKPHEHHKPLKRLHNSEIKKSSSSLSETSKEKRHDGSVSIRSSTSDITVLTTQDKNKQRSISSSSMSPIYRSIPMIRKQTAVEPSVKKTTKVKRPLLPSEYHCSIALPRIDLSMYDLDLPPIVTSANSLPMAIESISSTSPSSSSSSEQQVESSSVPAASDNMEDAVQPIVMIEQENIHESDEQNIYDAQTFDDINTDELPANIVNGFLTPDLNEPLSTTNNVASSPSTNDILLQPPAESVRPTTNEVSSLSTNETLPQITSDVVTETPNESLSNAIDEVSSEVTNETSQMIMDEIPQEISDEALPLITTETMNEALLLITTDTEMETSDEVLSSTANDVQIETAGDALIPTTKDIVSVVRYEADVEPISPASYIAFSPELPPLDDDPVLFAVETPQVSVTDTSNIVPQEYLIIVPCSDDEDDFDNDELHDHRSDTTINDTDKKTTELLSTSHSSNTSPLLHNPLLTRVLTNIHRSRSDRLSISSSSSCSSISTSILHNQTPQSPLQLTEISLTQKILNKKHRKSSQTLMLNGLNISIPLLPHEPLIDPRLIYRLQSITTDLRWSNPCDQCSLSDQLPSLFTSSTQTISSDRKYSSDYVDPRRESLKNAILNSIYQRLNILLPNVFIINSNQFQKFLFEQTIFKTNCALHLEHLLHQIKLIDDANFFQMIKINDQFQLSPSLLQLIFN